MESCMNLAKPIKVREQEAGLDCALAEEMEDLEASVSRSSHQVLSECWEGQGGRRWTAWHSRARPRTLLLSRVVYPWQVT